MLLLITSHQGQHFSRMPAGYNSVKCLRREPESHVKIDRAGRFDFLEEEVWLLSSLSSSSYDRAQTMQYSRDH